MNTHLRKKRRQSAVISLASQRGNIAILFLLLASIVVALVTFHDRIPVLRNLKPAEETIEGASDWETLGEEMHRVHDQGDKLTAYRFSRKRHTFARDHFPHDDMRYLEAVHDAGYLAMDAKNFSHAKKFLKTSLELLTQRFGENHPKVANEYGLLAMTYAKMYTDQRLSSSDQQKAEAYFEECLRIYREYAPEDEFYPNYKEIAAYYYEKMGQPERAAMLRNSRLA